MVYATGSGDVNQPRTGRKMKPKALGGPVLDDPATKDRRVRLATWLASPGNPFFAKSLVNRIWFHLIGRGIVEPVDDFRDSNPSSNDALLEGLAADFVKNGYDLKKLIRSILHSRTYQLSATTNSLNADDSLYFSHAQTRLLPAEVLLDAISTVTSTTTSFDGLPRGARATQIPDGKMENPFLKTFGRPARELACECERESDSNLSQALQLIGGATVNGKLPRRQWPHGPARQGGQVARAGHARALHGRPQPRPEPDRAGRGHQAPQVRKGLSPGRRGPRLGADQLQGIPVPALSPWTNERHVQGTIDGADANRDCRRPSIMARQSNRSIHLPRGTMRRARWACASVRSTRSPIAVLPAIPLRFVC